MLYGQIFAKNRTVFIHIIIKYDKNKYNLFVVLVIQHKKANFSVEVARAPDSRFSSFLDMRGTEENN